MHHLARRTTTIAGGLIAAATLAIFAAPASAAPNGCNSSNAVCLYDGKYYAGTFTAVGCGRIRDSVFVEFTRIRGRVGSVVNGCGFSIYLADLTYTGGISPRVSVSDRRWVGPKQWFNDLGQRGFDNRATAVAATPLYQFSR